MNIKVDLISDWVDMTLAEIEELQKQGFVFDTFKKWKPIRVQELSSRLQHSKGDSYQKTKHRLSKEVLREDFKNHLLRSYVGLSHRLIEPNPRKIHYANNFKGFDLLLSTTTLPISFLRHAWI